MELILKEGLPHQQNAIDAVCDVFSGVRIEKPTYYYMNPQIDLGSSQVKVNINEIQKALHPTMRGFREAAGYLNLDIKMETGTGKTYVYTKMIFELHKRYGINKFFIAVPSLAIKAGTEQFISDAYVKKHFRDVCQYGTEIELQVLESKPKKKGKSFFPSAVREFVQGSCQNTKKIYVFLVNMHLLTDRKNTMLVRDDYDYGVEGFYRPVDALKATRPVMIIDEPHRFSRDQKTFKFIEDYICPQCIIRFGATFPLITLGTGKNKTTRKDYQNLLYDLNACDSFNLNLIKGVAKEHFEPVSKKEAKVKLVTVKSKDSATFHYIERGKPAKTVILQKGEPLSLIATVFEGLYIEGIGKNFVELTNGQIKNQGEEFATDIYSTPYQEQMLRLALERHFEAEKANFNRKFKIKTLSLFFIDDIHSYRVDEKNGKEPYLLKAFERLLKERIDIELANITEHDNPMYKEFLLATKADVSAAHAGYFSQDNNDSDEEIARQVNEILFEKKKLLSFYHKDGNLNTRRFLFSKWTLKEGWDNPNVFTIAKLRSSGSEISKMQEVGRGLRLPVDENGNRISNEQFYLNYIVDFTEADFANELIKQINGELPGILVITSEQLERVAARLGKESDDLFAELLIKKYVDRNMNVKEENIDAFYAEYPDFAAGVEKGKVEDRNKPKTKPVKIRKAVYAELKTLWESLNEKYLLYYENIEKKYFEDELLKILENDVFVDVVMMSRREVVKSEQQMTIVAETGVQYLVEKPLAYGEFLQRVHKQTNIPISQIHGIMRAFHDKHCLESRLINEYSAANFAHKFSEWKAENLRGRFKYAKTNTPPGSTVLSYKDGTPKEEIVQGRIGKWLEEGEPAEKYLYDALAYDSPLELENIKTDIDEVVVYGKIPRNSIAIPTTTGGTYSPDFMYVVKKKNGEKTLNVIVETKDVQDKTELRGSESAKIECAREFFKQLKIDGYEVKFYEQLNNKKMIQIIRDALSN